MTAPTREKKTLKLKQYLKTIIHKPHTFVGKYYAMDVVIVNGITHEELSNW